MINKTVDVVSEEQQTRSWIAIIVTFLLIEDFGMALLALTLLLFCGG